MLTAGQETTAIAKVVGCTMKTLRREITRGTWTYLDGATYDTNLLLKASFQPSLKTLFLRKKLRSVSTTFNGD